MRLGAGVGEAVAHVQLGGMAAPAETIHGRRRRLAFSRAGIGDGDPRGDDKARRFGAGFRRFETRAPHQGAHGFKTAMELSRAGHR